MKVGDKKPSGKFVYKDGMVHTTYYATCAAQEVEQFLKADDTEAKDPATAVYIQRVGGPRSAATFTLGFLSSIFV